MFFKLFQDSWTSFTFSLSFEPALAISSSSEFSPALTVSSLLLLSSDSSFSLTEESESLELEEDEELVLSFRCRSSARSVVLTSHSALFSSLLSSFVVSSKFSRHSWSIVDVTWDCELSLSIIWLSVSIVST